LPLKSPIPISICIGNASLVVVFSPSELEGANISITSDEFRYLVTNLPSGFFALK